jgi:3-hydroxyisobutyrate dehydrogenase-like beta-hydroxyacid dehydrogenase
MIGAMAKLGFIGLGAMGSRTAARLVDAGHEVVVWNRTPDKAAALTERGASAGSNPADVAAHSELVLTMLADPSALRDVVEGPEGLAAGASGATTVVEMSTVGPDAIAQLREALPRETGLLDAPVLGSTSEAEGGRLQIFVGGDRALFDRWDEVLSVLGKPIHVGPLGMGAAAKLVANSTLLAALIGVGEAIALADSLGLPREQTFEVLSVTPLAAQAERRRSAIESSEYPRRFALSLAHKDATLILEAAAGAGLELRLIAAAREWLAAATEAGLGEADYASVIAYILGRASNS